MNITIESDSMLLVVAINNFSEHNSSVGLLFNGCKTQVDSIKGCSIVHVRRSTNWVAYCLARAYASRTGLGESRTSPPLFLSYIIAFDLK